MNDPTCSSAGISLDGTNDYIALPDREFGGATSFEAYVKYDSFSSYSRILHFGNTDGTDQVYLCTNDDTSTIGFYVRRGSTGKLHADGNFDSHTWTHVVVTVSGRTMKIYKNGLLAGTRTDGHEPNTLTRNDHTIGSLSGTSRFFDGIIAYLNTYSVELSQSEITSLYAPHNTAHHFWDFRDCSDGSPTTDSIAGDLSATAQNGAACSSEGMKFDGNNDVVDVDDWNWGGKLAFEVYIKYDSFISFSRVFDFGVSVDTNNVVLANSGSTSTIAFATASNGPVVEYLLTSNFDSFTWTHVVVTSVSSTFKIYKNGVLSETFMGGSEPNVVLRTANSIGARADGTSYFFDGTIAYLKLWHGVEFQQSDVTALYAPHNTAHHFWDFRGCNNGASITDSIAGYLSAAPRNGPTCSPSGITIADSDDYLDIIDWEWGGTTSIEVLVRYDSFNSYGRIFDFGNGAGNDDVMLYNGDDNKIDFGVRQGTTWKVVTESSFGLGEWTHVTLTVSGNTMKTYKNGALVGTKIDGHEPNVLTRTNHVLGNRAETDRAFDGTIAYLKIWHGVELQQSDVDALPTQPCQPGDYGLGYPDGCTPCPIGAYTEIVGESSCSLCPDGKTTLYPASTSSSSCVHDTHTWNFMGCLDDNPVVDVGSSLAATAQNNARSSGTNMKVYKNGVLAGTYTDGHEPNVLTRTQHWLGRSPYSNDPHSNDGYFDGTIAYLKIYHNKELTDSEVSDLQNAIPCVAGAYGTGYPDCNPCPLGTYSPSPGSSFCTLCPSGKTGYVTSASSWLDSCVEDSTHEFNFMSCSDNDPTFDSTVGSQLKAVAKGGATCSAEGMVLDGVNDFVDIDDWKWGSTTSIEILVKYDEFNSNAPVFDFGSGDYADNVVLSNWGDSAVVKFSVRQGGAVKSLQASNFEEGGWTHLVVTVSGSTLKTYKDGVLANTNTEAWEPNVITRTQHWLGQSGRPTDGHFKGTIAKLKIWHNKELSPEEINALPKLPCFPGTYGFGYPDCQVCAAGSFSTSVDATQCSSCPIGKFLSDDGVDAAKHDHLEDCDVCEAGKYNDDDATDPSLHASCTICLDGKYNADAGTSAANHIECTSCPAGKKNDKVGATNHNGADDCDLCSPGTFASHPGSATCATCPEGQSSGSGATNCGECPVGYVCTSDGRQVPCPSGEFSSGSSECLTCPIGHKCPGATDKIPCDAATFQANEGHPSCDICEAGKYQTDEGQVSCEVCPAGFFCPRSSSAALACGSHALYCPESSSNVIPVGPGQYTLPATEETKTTRVSQAICEIGHACGGGEKRPCDDAGEYADETGLNACKIAPAGSKPTAEHDGVEDCPASTYSVGGTSECTPCEFGTFSSPGSVGCKSCDPGEIPIDSVCVKCEAGSYASFGATVCVPCDLSAGEYSDEGAGYCAKCPQYETFNPTTNKCECLKTFERIGGTCTCKAGETLMGTACAPCEKAKWKATAGVSSCNLCEDALKGGTTKQVRSMEVDDCTCPSGTYDNEEGKCVVVEEGMDPFTTGMSLANVKIQPGWWRTGKTSIDVRECPVEAACVGGNGTDYCREGHNGPYCNLCIDGYAKDPFFMCGSCDTSVEETVYSCSILVAVALGFFCLTYYFKKKSQQEQEERESEGRPRGSSTYKVMKRKFKNGAKIIFSGAQIFVSLPSVVPTLTLPENLKDTLAGMQVLNLNFFQFLSMGCWTSSFNKYDQVLATTVPILILCGVLLGCGLWMRRYRQIFFTTAIAVTYLTLPTVTTMTFSLFPCDDLDDGRSYLRADYSIDCDGEKRTDWTIFGALMILAFPVGVTGAYWMLLWVDRENIMMPVGVREQDEGLMSKAFLFEPYKPEFWYFEVVETLRRLSMTGLLSAIRPGSFTQLSAGLLMSIAYVVGISNIHPYVETRDNVVALLTGLQLILVFVTASFMKYDVTEDGSKYDMNGMGVILIVSYVMIFILFLVWAIYQKDDQEESTTHMATSVIKNMTKAATSKKGFEIELISKRGVGGDQDQSMRGIAGEDVFTCQNPMARPSGGGPGKKNQGSIVEEEEEEEEVEEDVKSLAAPKPTANPLPCPWTKTWDDSQQAFYYIHDDGETSTWDEPVVFVEK
ncbi:hypothetical protein TrLO_g13981 [Triparma laevis f. longispina]|uniref:WW domain-containing protein n=1 Tax=Triparma laevis f. longispina TaxID=1714387 RepID=A0A9W7CET1_9STRA|nr:hypothetical protein TrLO_g13981 [Triparma laevis f. longispina]